MKQSCIAFLIAALVACAATEAPPQATPEVLSSESALELSCSDKCSYPTIVGCAAFSFVPAAGFGAALACGFATYEFCKRACEAPDPIKVNEAAARACLLEALPEGSKAKVMGAVWSTIKFQVSNVKTRDGHTHTGHAAIVRSAAGPKKILLSWRIGNHHVRPLTEVNCSEAMYTPTANISLSSWAPDDPPAGTPDPGPYPEPPPPVDSTPPTVTSFVSANNANPATFVANASDDTGVAVTRIRRDGVVIAEHPGGASSVSVDTNTWADGVYFITAEAVDYAGNVGYVAAKNFVLDRTAPVVTALGDGTLVTSFSELRCQVADLTPASINFYMDSTYVASAYPSSGTVRADWNTRILPDGYYTYRCVVTDQGGLTGTGTARIYVQNEVGGTMIKYPIFKAYTATAADPFVAPQAIVGWANTVSITFTGPSFNCGQTYDVNQPGYKTLDCDGSSSSRPGVYVGGLADGVMSLYEESKQTYINGSGSYGQGRSFYVDNTAPLIQMDAANTHAFEDGTLQLSAVSPTPLGWWSDFPDSIAKVEFFARLADNTTVSLGSVASEKDRPWKLQALLPTGAARNGAATLFAVATDLVYSRRDTPVNRTGTSTDLTVAVDSIAPHVAIGSPVTGSLQGDQLILAANVSDSNLRNVKFALDGPAGPVELASFEPGGAYSQEFDATTLPYGPYTFTVTAEDLVGNRTATSSNFIKIKGDSQHNANLMVDTTGWVGNSGATVSRLTLTNVPGGTYALRMDNTTAFSSFGVENNPNPITSTRADEKYTAELSVAAATDSSVGKWVLLLIREFTQDGQFVKSCTQWVTLGARDVFTEAAIRDCPAQAAGNQVDFHAYMVGASATDSFMLHRVGLNVSTAESAVSAAKPTVAAPELHHSL